LRHVRGIIISGGPASVTEPTSPSVDTAIYTLDVPVLGICYGHQLLARDLGGPESVKPGVTKEYGHALLTAANDCELCANISAGSAADLRFRVWMSHGDTVQEQPPGFKVG